MKCNDLQEGETVLEEEPSEQNLGQRHVRYCISLPGQNDWVEQVGIIFKYLLYKIYFNILHEISLFVLQIGVEASIDALSVRFYSYMIGI